LVGVRVTFAIGHIVLRVTGMALPILGQPPSHPDEATLWPTGPDLRWPLSTPPLANGADFEEYLHQGTVRVNP
jgi:hypothetical protein